MRLAAAALLVMLLAQPALARARNEPPPELVEHARVRVTLLAPTPDRPVGTLLAIRPEALELDGDRTIPRAEIKKIEMSRGTFSSADKGAKVGGILGGIAGVCFGVLAAAINEAEGGKSPPVAVGFGLGILGAVSGAGVGAVIGSAFEHEHWDKAVIK